VLVVIGGGPYGIATSAKAIEAGIETVVVGRPLGFWTDNMPAGMYLRSGPDWHLDASGVHTFEAFLQERGMVAADIDPVPIAVFLDYAAWFQRHKHVTVRESLVSALRTESDGSFLVTLDDGETLAAESVVAAPGVRYFQHQPEWSAPLPQGLCSHTCELVRFEDFEGARVLIVGGRQSAYEWAALIGEHGAERSTSCTAMTCRASSGSAGSSSMPTSSGHSPRQAGGGNSLLPGRRRSPASSGSGPPHPRVVANAPAPGGPIPSPAGGVGGCRRGRGPAAARVQLSDGTELSVDRIVCATGYKRISAGCRISPGCSTASRLPTGSRCWTRPSRRASPACTCRVLRPRGTSARSSASRRAAPQRPNLSLAD